MDPVVVYKANTESLPIVLGLLRKEGFSPTTLEDPTIVPYRGAHRHVVHIAVPREQAPGAASILRKWDEAQKSDVKEKTGAMAGPLLFSTMVTIGLAFVFLFFGILLEAVALLFVLWLVVFALAANAEKITKIVKRRNDGKARRG
jgi:hypothetical protein